MSKRPVPFWLIALAVFFLLLCSYLIAPGYATDLETSPGAAVLQECSSLEGDPGAAGLPSDVSGSSQEAPEDTSTDEDPGAAGLPSDVSGSSQEAPEDTSTDEDPGAAGLPSDASASSQEAPEDTSTDEDLGAAGLPSAPVLLYFSDYVAPQSEDPGEAGLPSDFSASSQEAPEDTSTDEDPGAAGLPSDFSASSQEAPEDTTMDEDPGEAGESEASASTETDLQALNQSVENVHADLWLLLFTFWGFAGVFLGYKVGGVVLGRL